MKLVAIEGAGSLPTALVAELGYLGWNVEHRSAASPGNVVPDSLVIVASDAVTALIARVRAAMASTTVIIIDGCAGGRLNAHLLIAAIEPLAIEAAPRRRICAVEMRSAADPADLVAAVDFLLRTPSVTGQVIRIDPREAAIN